MIKAHFLSNNDTFCGFLLKGHADSGEFGYDIVCAAVSVLAINTVNSLEQLAFVTPQVVSDDDNGGYLKVSLEKNEAKKPAVQLLLKSFRLGIQSIIDNYRDYITIESE